MLTCTLTDLAGAREETPAESDPVVAALKASGQMAGAIEKAVAFYEQPPTEPLEVSTSWADVQVTGADWAEAFAAPDPGTPHNEAREQVWDALVHLLIDQHDDEVPADLAAARRHGPGLRSLVGAGLPTHVCPVAERRAGSRAPAPGPARLDPVRSAVAGCGTAPAR